MLTIHSDSWREHWALCENMWTEAVTYIVQKDDEWQVQWRRHDAVKQVNDNRVTVMVTQTVWPKICWRNRGGMCAVGRKWESAEDSSVNLEDSGRKVLTFRDQLPPHHNVVSCRASWRRRDYCIVLRLLSTMHSFGKSQIRLSVVGFKIAVRAWV